MADKFNLKRAEKRIDATLRRTIVLIGNEAKNFFVGSFRKQGFTNRSFRRWQSRKNEVSGFGVASKSKGGRAILVQSGDLLRSIQRKTSFSTLSTTISTDLPYAAMHNNGEIIHRRAHKRTAKRGSLSPRSGRGGGRKRTMSGKRHNVKGSTFKMPKREFIGNSVVLDRKIEKIIEKEIMSLFI